MHVGVLTASVMISLALATRAADDPKPPEPRPAATPARPAPAPPPPPGANPWGPGFGGGAQQQPWATRVYLWQTLSLVTEMNMTPEFTLSGDQKAKIIAIRDAMKKEQEDWREAHAPEFKGLQDEMMALRGNDPATRERWAEISRGQTELMNSAPKEDEAVAQVRAVLTNEQLKILETEENRRKAEAERQRQEMMKRWEEQMAKQPKPGAATPPPTPTPAPKP
jgi:hypothetical protein